MKRMTILLVAILMCISALSLAAEYQIKATDNGYEEHPVGGDADHRFYLNGSWGDWDYGTLNQYGIKTFEFSDPATSSDLWESYVAVDNWIMVDPPDGYETSQFSIYQHLHIFERDWGE